MCQLLGMNCNVPTDICFSFEGFCARGGITADHADGWGIAFFEGKAAGCFIDAHPSTSSPSPSWSGSLPHQVQARHRAHPQGNARRAVALQNCHPFQRELWGRYLVFAHDRTLADFAAPTGDVYRAVGETDTEAAFCWMLDTCARVSRRQTASRRALRVARRGRRRAPPPTDRSTIFCPTESTSSRIARRVSTTSCGRPSSLQRTSSIAMSPSTSAMSRRRTEIPASV